jgi:hypothetical protein
MTLPEVLAYLQREKVDVTVRHDELLIRAQPGVIGSELVPLLKLYKRELLFTFGSTEFASSSEKIAQEGAAPMRITPEMLPLINLSQPEIDQIVASVPGGVANVQDIYPLAPSQEGILFHHLLEKSGDTYLVRTILAFDSRSRRDAFLRALQAVIDRHDLLRSAVYWRGLSRPVQVVHRQAQLPVKELALIPGENGLAQLRVETDRSQLRMDLQRAPLLSAYTTEEAHSGEWLLSLLMHHMVSDHVTLELMLSEIQLLLQGHTEDLPKPLPYRNFIAQADQVTPEEHESYFRQQLGDVDEPTAAFGIIDVHGDGSRLEETRLRLSHDLALRIRNAAREQGVTPAVLFHVAWAQVLA